MPQPSLVTLHRGRQNGEHFGVLCVGRMFALRSVRQRFYFGREHDGAPDADMDRIRHSAARRDVDHGQDARTGPMIML
jgi:hypothetical protein